MFAIGFSEIIVVLVVALVVLGPEKFPIAVHNCLKFIKQIHKLVNQAKQEINQEFREINQNLVDDNLDSEIYHTINEFHKDLKSTELHISNVLAKKSPEIQQRRKRRQLRQLRRIQAKGIRK